MEDTAPDPAPVKVIRNAEQPEGHVVHPHEMADRLVVVVEFGGVDDQAIQRMHLENPDISRGAQANTAIFQDPSSPHHEPL